MVLGSRAGCKGARTGAVGVLVRERRRSAGITQRELAAAAGVSIGALRDLEQGRTWCPRWGVLTAIADALGIDWHERAELVGAWAGGQHGDDDGSSAVPALARAGATRPRICVLGPLTAVRDGMPVSLGSSRQRAVLGLLALRWPAGVPRDVIVEVLWPALAPRSAVAEVQAYVSRLRRLLDPVRVPHGSGDPVPLDSGRYRLGDGLHLDLAEFEQLSRRADSAAARGEPRLACALYERSLALWRGEVLADIDLLQSYPAATAATRRHGEVVQRFAHAAASVNRQEITLQHLRKLCDREPFNERSHAYLMTALAVTGQQAAAVRLFGQLRCRLDSELGVRPGPQVAAAYVRILRQQVGRWGGGMA
jgi:DNA-binding SARP family transcriptional activator/transcriptional regulator with XRE-family HTH domain